MDSKWCSLIIQNMESTVSVRGDFLYHLTFQMQIHGLTLHLMHKDNVIRIGEVFGKLNQIDDSEDSRVCSVGFVCCNVDIDI